MRKYLAILLLAMVCFSCHAHRLHHHMHHHRHHHTIVVTTPSRPVTANRLTARDRLNMAIAYLNKNQQLSAKQYSKMTGLPKATAEAELDAFALDRNIPIGIAAEGKKKTYILVS